jgi:hypothetical protein
VRSCDYCDRFEALKTRVPPHDVEAARARTYFSAARSLGIDETPARRGQHDIGLFHQHCANRVLDVLPEHRRTHDKRAAYRLNVVIWLGSGGSAEQVAQALLMEADTSRTYFKRYTHRIPNFGFSCR